MRKLNRPFRAVKEKQLQTLLVGCAGRAVDQKVRQLGCVEADVDARDVVQGVEAPHDVLRVLLKRAQAMCE